ncbi:MAG: O-antigen ligase family protein [Planctomycetota bacterium]
MTGEPKLRIIGHSPAVQPESFSLFSLLHMPIVSMVGICVIFAAAFFNLASLEVEKDKVEFDMQVAVKLLILGVAGLYGGWGFLTDPRVRKLLTTLPGAFFSVILVAYCLAISSALDTTNAIASTAGLVGIVLASATLLVQIGLLPMLHTLFYALALYNLGSWFAFFVVPEIGIFDEPIADGEFFVRMGGLGHPNTLGQFSGVTIVLGAILWVYYDARSLWRALIIVSAAGCLVASLSRGSTVATAIALLIAFRSFFFSREMLQYWVLLAILAIFGMIGLLMIGDPIGYVEGKLTSLTKSGEVSELTTATGRSEIWAYTLRLIAEQPLLGYGATCSKFLLEDYVSYAHNMVLNVALNAGAFAGLSVVGFFVYRIRECFHRFHPIDGLLIFLMINGFVENVAFTNLPGMPTIMLFTSVVFWQLKGDPALELKKPAADSRRNTIGNRRVTERQLV